MNVSFEKRKMDVSESVYRAFVEETSDVQDREEWRFFAISVMQMFIRALEGHARFNLINEDLLEARSEMASHAESGLRRIHLVPKFSGAEASAVEKR